MIMISTEGLSVQDIELLVRERFLVRICKKMSHPVHSGRKTKGTHMACMTIETFPVIFTLELSVRG